MLDPIQLRSPTQEIMLLDYVERLDKFRSGRICVHLHLSDLGSIYKRKDFIRIADETFTACVRSFEGRMFMLNNDDIVYIAKDVTNTMLETAVNRLRVLFNEDPLAQIHEEYDKHPDLCSWYDLETNYDELLDIVKNLRRQAELSLSASDFPLNLDPNKLLSPIRPELLAKLELALIKADVSNVVRRQTVCTIIENQKPQPLFEEIFVSIEDLQSIATPGIDLMANFWLFHSLTQTLDRRVMKTLMRDGINTNRPFSINLNISTILSSDFSRFEAIITPQLRGRLVIELNKLDVFSDMGAFQFARDYLHDRGFRLCLDGLTHQTLPYYGRAKLGFDLIKIYWTPESIDIMLPEMIPAIRNFVMETGQARTILCRCDNELAIKTGQDLGIVMFQGRQVDRVLNINRISLS